MSTELELNAAILDLVKCEPDQVISIKKAAAVVIQSGTSLETASRLTFKTTVVTRDIYEGGNLEHSKEFGIFRKRVGRFEVWRDSEDVLMFRYHQGLCALEETPTKTYRVRYDPKTLELEHFGVMDRRIVFHLWFIKISKWHFIPIYGKEIEGEKMDIRIRL